MTRIVVLTEAGEEEVVEGAYLYAAIPDGSGGYLDRKVDIGDLPGAAGGMDAVSDDTSPTLGGDLDPDGHAIGDASEADLTKLSQVNASAAELNYSVGVSSLIQTQLNALTAADATKAALAGATFTGPIVFSGTTNAGIKIASLTTTERDALTEAVGMVIWNSTASEFQGYNGSSWIDLGAAGGGGGGSLDNVVEDLSPQLGGNLDLNGFTAGDATAADLTKLHALTATSTELNYVDGVTSAIQTQLDAKESVTNVTTGLALKGNLTGGTYSGAINFSGTGHGGIRPVSLTTTQRDALSAAAGMFIWNTTTTTFDGYGAGWDSFAMSADLDAATITFTGADPEFFTDIETVDDALALLGEQALRRDEALALEESLTFGASDNVVAVLSDGSFAYVNKQNLGIGVSQGSITAVTSSRDIAPADFGNLLRVTGTSAVTLTFTTASSAGLASGSRSRVSILRDSTANVSIVFAAGNSCNGNTAGTITLGTRYEQADISYLETVASVANYISHEPVPSTVADVTNPSIALLSPVDGATGVPSSAVFVATFDEAIVAGTGDVLYREGGVTIETFNIATGAGDNGGTVAVSGNTLTITPGDPLTADAAWSIRIAATCIDDLSGNSYAGIANDTSWNGTVAAAAGDPTFVDSASIEISNGSGSQTVDLTGLGAQTGDIVTLAGACDIAISAPAGWTEIADDSIITRAYVVHKVMGAVPDASVDIPRQSGASRKIALVMFVTRNASATPDAISAWASNSSGLADPPTLAQVDADCIRYAVATINSTNTVFTTPPSGWTMLEALATTDSNSANACTLAVARLDAAGSAAASVDPGTFGATTGNWVAMQFTYTAA
jgi:hypothetical protein